MFENFLILVLIIFAVGTIFFLINTEERENHRSAYMTIFMVLLLSLCWFSAYNSFNSPEIIAFSNRLINLGANILFPILLYSIHRLLSRKFRNDYLLYIILFLICTAVVIFIWFLVLLSLA